MCLILRIYRTCFVSCSDEAVYPSSSMEFRTEKYIIVPAIHNAVAQAWVSPTSGLGQNICPHTQLLDSRCTLQRSTEIGTHRFL